MSAFAAAYAAKRFWAVKVPSGRSVRGELECEPSTIQPRFLRLSLDDYPADTLRAPGPASRGSTTRCSTAKPLPSLRRTIAWDFDGCGESLPPRERTVSRNGVSEPVSPGAVQVIATASASSGCRWANHWRLPEGGHVISADLDRLAQLRPGQIIGFAP